MNLVNLALKHIEKFDEVPLLYYQDQAYTNVQLNKMGRKLAAGLKSMGVGRGDHVVVSMSNRPEVFACFQAIWQIGAVIIPIMFLLGEDETRHILDHSDAKVVIVSQDILEKIKNSRKGIEHVKNIIVLGGKDEGDLVSFENLVDSGSEEKNVAEVADSDIAQIIYTSGTTGRPKGVMLSHKNLHDNAVGAWDANEFDKAPSTILCLPLAHSFGVVAMNALNVSTYKDAYDVLMDWFDPEQVFQLIEKYRINNFIGVPTMFQVLLNHPSFGKYNLSSLKRCTISASPITEELYRAFTKKFKCKMYEGYGLTEASASVTLCRPSMPLKKGSCGVPHPGVEVKIFDNNDQELAPGEQGEIVVKGPSVMVGYYKMHEETKTVMQGGWLHTEDIGYMDDEGYIYVTDRIKDMIIKGGYNIYPSEIEGYLDEHPAVQEVSVIGIPHEKYGEDVLAFIVLMPDQQISEDEIIEYAKSRMTPFKAPSRVRFVDALPKTPIGKVQKKELRKMEL